MVVPPGHAAQAHPKLYPTNPMDTWITLAPSDVLASINNAELTAALSTALATGQAGPLDTLMPDVIAEVRGYVRVRNTLGQPGQLPQELKNAAIDIIIYRAANRLRKTAIAADKRADYEDALRKLEAVAAGTFAVSVPDLPTTDLTSAPQPRVGLPHREFDWTEEDAI